MRESQASSSWQLFQYCRYFGQATIEMIDSSFTKSDDYSDVFNGTNLLTNNRLFHVIYEPGKMIFSQWQMDVSFVVNVSNHRYEFT
jgi:hypothetical protein